MLYVIRDFLLLRFARSKATTSLSDKVRADAPYLDLRFIWPMGVVDPSESATTNGTHANGKKKAQ